ncbi:biotin transporter BioY [Bacillus sp. BHET2]|uniref:biotin transporter BioY n=1 Tax=Bacillus sp. BHET2 TaxID=2583818 RepID=UPI00110DB469|nr:biotin transporter BioY [Bacillus sp. BHET2]TMU88220.1 biotin transporter BioY [Bacillus sp. BHET2]
MRLKDMILVSMFTAIVAALGVIPPIALPFTPVPITAQTFGVMLAGAVLGARLGGLSLGLFVLLVGIGAPILSGGRGGLPILIGPSGGYILSWPIAAFVIGFLVDRYKGRLKLWNMILFNVIGGIIIVYVGGITFLSLVTELTWMQAAISALTYIPGDVVKAVIAGTIALQLHKAAPIAKFHNEKKAA